MTAVPSAPLPPGDWRPDAADDDADILPSFAALRLKTLATLYPPVSSNNSTNYTRDKSPKGSVDAPIQSLVDLLNAHPSFATLSSCSGRIALYDAELTLTVNGNGEEDTDTTAVGDEHDAPRQTASPQTPQHNGKGGRTGGWLLAAHDPVDPHHVLSLIHPSRTSSTAASSVPSPLPTPDHTPPHRSLALEPLLLHVAANSVRRAQQLLQVALGAGFRESGIVLTHTRATVAIRSHALAVQIPLFGSSDNSSSDTDLSAAYLLAVLEDCNRRLRLNHDKMRRLEDALCEVLFVRWPRTLHTRRCGGRIPPLHLWGHATVLRPTGPTRRSRSSPEPDWELLVFGGYGSGPLAQPACGRSAAVYRLTTTNQGDAWADQWEPVTLSPVDNDSRLRLRQIPVHNDTNRAATPFTARQGLAACLLEDQRTVLLFGGRGGPAAPLGDLWLYTTEMEKVFPTRVQGVAPTPRWGHSMTRLSGNRVVLLGGRDETKVLDDAYILSFGTDLQGPYVQWTRLEFPPGRPVPGPRCFHAAVTDGSEQRLWVWGGISDTTTLLPEQQQQQSSVWLWDGRTSHEIPLDGSVPVMGQAVVPGIVDLHGNARCHHFLSIGGVGDCSDANTLWIQSLSLVGDLPAKSWKLENGRVQLVDEKENGPLDCSSLVQHSVVPLPSPAVGVARYAIVGGGVQGFAFGPSFAMSCVIEVEWVYEDSVTPAAAVATNATRIPKNRVSGESKVDKAIPVSTDVLYVQKRNAKQLKTLLENAGLLDKKFRITPADTALSALDDPVSCMAVPVVPTALQIWQSAEGGDAIPWGPLVAGTGRQGVLWSSSTFARNKCS
jgi:tRNA wybutosine-synthesizing protein 3